jgi:hypothetical protein
MVVFSEGALIGSYERGQIDADELARLTMGGLSTEGTSSRATMAVGKEG